MGRHPKKSHPAESPKWSGEDTQTSQPPPQKQTPPQSNANHFTYPKTTYTP